MSLKVALLVPYSLDRPGGVAQQALGLGAWLAGQGHDPVLIAPGTREVAAGFPVRLLGRATGLPFNGSTAELALNPGQGRRALALAAQADVIHVHEPLTPGMAYATARGAEALVVTHHAAYALGLARLLRPRAARLPRRVATAVSGSAAETAHAATGRWPRVIPNGIAMPAAPEGDREDLVLFLGRRDDPRKGYREFGHLARAIPEARFVALGPGRRSEPAVAELGWVSEATKQEFLGRARVLVAPHGYGESFGLILVEALARGCAVVGYGLPAFRAVIDDPTVADWVRPGDREALVAAVRRRLAAPVDPLAAWRSARRYSWDEVGPRVADAYRAAIAGHDIG